MPAQPLHGIRVLDFSIQLPGPLATLMLAEAGATVVKVERPGTGDLARGATPGDENPEFALLNRGKRSVVLDLKESEGQSTALKLASEADIVVEQFRPGTMDRLGLGYDAIRKLNPKVIYCSITGYGQTGHFRNRAGHDLNYAALAGLLDISEGSDGEPVLPPTQLADIGGGSYPAVLNMLLALRTRDVTGAGKHLDISMTDNLFTWMRRPLAKVFRGNAVPARGTHPSAGGLARYNIYRTRDGRHVSIAAIEDKFWLRLCELVGLAPEFRSDARAREAKIALREIFSTRDLADWMSLFSKEDVCVEPLLTIDEAVAAADTRLSQAFDARLQLVDGGEIAALPVPIDAGFRGLRSAPYPRLGAQTHDLDAIWKC